MRIKLIFHLLAVVLIVNFSEAKNEIKRRRPIIDTTAQDSDGNYIDQIASDSISYSSSNVVTAPENFGSRYHTATDQFRKPSTRKVPKEQKVHYITPEPYNKNFSHDYVYHALNTQEKSKDKSPASSFLEYSSLTRDESKKVMVPKRKKVYESEPEDYIYNFPESKRITAKTTLKPITVKDDSEKYYKPQSPGAVITKDQKTNDDDFVNTYHYYYPEDTSSDETANDKSFDRPSSSWVPPTTKAPKMKFSNKKTIPLTQENTSTDSYQYQPVLQRPSESFKPSENPKNDFFDTFANYETTKNLAYHSAPPKSTPSPIKMRRPTKRNNFYLPSSTLPLSSTSRPLKIRQPSTEAPYEDVKQFSVSPSPSPKPHFSTTRASDFQMFSSTPAPTFSSTRAPEVHEYSTTRAPETHKFSTTRDPEVYNKYSTPSPISSSTFDDFYIKASTQVTPSGTPSAVDLSSAENQDRTVVIRPKTNYQNHDSFEPIKEQIIYKFVPEVNYVYEPNKTESTGYYSTSATFPEIIQSPDYYKAFNQSTHAEADFYNNYNQKNYNYEYFTEQDAGPMGDDDDQTMKMDQQSRGSEDIDDKQKASKKNMYFPMNPQLDEYQQNPIMASDLEDHEMPPPQVDNDAEASKNQYFVLYSIDEEEKRQKKLKRRPKPTEPEVIYHHHQHQHEQNEKGEEYHNFGSEYDSEFDSELTNSDNVRIVDPGVRGGRPIEFTKDDYLRHIKQAVVQYMKDYQPKEQQTSGSSMKLKNQRFTESQETPHRPMKSPSSTPSYKHSLPAQQYKAMAPMKLPKNVYSAGRLKDALDELQESPQVDLTVKKHKQKPFDLSAIDVGQSYQHVSHFDHSAALKNVEEFDQSNVVSNHQSKPKLHFSQQTYHDINNLQKHKQQSEDSESDQSNLYKGYVLPNKFSFKGNQAGGGGQSSFGAMNYDGSKLPRIVPQHGHDDDDEDDNKVEDPVDAPIQIINGIPVANPYNIDLNTLKYMLGGIAQAEVNDQIKDLDESPSNNQKIPANWKSSFSPNQLGSFTSNAPIYQVYGQQENGQRNKKNSGQSGNHGSSNQQSKFPLTGSLMNFNKNRNQVNKQKNSHNAHKNNQNFGLVDFSGWNQMNKKHRVEPQPSSSNSQYVLRPYGKNKQIRDEWMHQKGAINRARQPQLSTDMRPPPPIKQKAQLRLKKVL